MSNFGEVNFEISAHPTDRVIADMADLYWHDFVPEEIRQENPEFYSKSRFFTRMSGYMDRPFFRCITARDDEDLIGFSTVACLIESSTWWDDLIPAREAGFYREDGTRTLAIFDVLVKRGYRGRKIASELHRLSTTAKFFERTTLLSSAPQQPAYNMWLHFGYEIVGHKKMDNGPELAVFLKRR